MTEELYQVYHHHRHGHDTFLFRFKPTPECTEPFEEMIAQQLGIDFEDDRFDEWMHFERVPELALWPLVDASIPLIEDNDDAEV